MSTATPQAPSKMRLTISCRIYRLLFFIITVATVIKPALVNADHPSRPSTLVLYDHQDATSPNRTRVIVVSPSGNYNGALTGFGSIAVLSNVLREGENGNSPALGQIVGQTTVAKDLSFYVSVAYELNTPSFVGSITVQGPTDSSGNGELAITGGTGDFRWARGYVELLLITPEGDPNLVLKTTFHIKYD